MRSIWVVVAICAATVSAYSEEGEEAYQRTARALGACLHQQSQMIFTPGSRIISADAYDDLLKEKCGYLEEQHEEEFFAL